jgi:hypothetical protein
MRRQLYRGGGIAGLYPRQNFGIGSKWQEFKDKAVGRARKLIPNELADIAGKAAPFVAMVPGWGPAAAGVMRGVSRLDKRGDLTDALKQGLGTYAAGELFDAGMKGAGWRSDTATGPRSLGEAWEGVTDTAGRIKDRAKESVGNIFKGDSQLGGLEKQIPGLGNISDLAKQQLLVGAVSGGLTYMYEKFFAEEPDQQPGETYGEFLARRKRNVAQKMRAYKDNYHAFDSAWNELSDEEKDAQINTELSDYDVQDANMNQGGRVGYQSGGISMANTLAENIRRNQAQAAANQGVLAAARANIGDLTRSFDPAGRSVARASLFGGPPSGVQTISPNQKPVDYSKFIQTPGAPPRMPGMGGMNQEDFMKLSEAEQMKMMDADVARQDAELEKYGSFADGRTIDPRAGGVSAYNDLLAVFRNDYPHVQLTGNETLAELDQMMLDIQDQQGYNQGGRVGLKHGTLEEGIKSLEAGAPDITYEGNEGPKAPIRMSRGPVLPEDPTKPINPWAPKPTGPVLPDKMMAAQGGRIGYRMGMGPAGLPGIPRMAPDGMEYDMRMNGGFQGLGAKEGKDDVPAMLAKNEFVFTADAVRGAGDGDIELGAQRMYDTMKNLEKRMA